MRYGVREYHRLRRAGWAAREAWHQAKTLERWRDAGGYETGDESEMPVCADPTVRLLVLPDDCPDLSYLDDEKVYSARERERVLEIANRDGVCGIVGQHWDGESWQTSDSVWGFIGDDWRDSGYDADVMDSALRAWEGREHCPTCGRPLAA